MDTRKKVIEALTEAGIDVSEVREDEDLDLQEYIADSLMFINFITTLEEGLGIELPGEFLSFDSIKSLNRFSESLDAVLAEA